MTYIKLTLIFLYTAILSVIAFFFGIVDRSFKLYFWLSKVFSKGILLISGIKLEVKGLENFNPGGVYVYVSNHSSMYDIPALQYAVPNHASIVFKQELGKIPIFGWQLKTGPYIIIDRASPERAMKSIERAKETMKIKGFSIILFSEGTRSKTDEVQPFKRGAFYLASRVSFPIIPVSISGTGKILPKGKLKIVPGKITVHFDKPIETGEIKSKKDELELMERVREIVIKNKEY